MNGVETTQEGEGNSAEFFKKNKGGGKAVYDEKSSLGDEKKQNTGKMRRYDVATHIHTHSAESGLKKTNPSLRRVC